LSGKLASDLEAPELATPACDCHGCEFTADDVVSKNENLGVH
jgi:hypothetical protein